MFSSCTKFDGCQKISIQDGQFLYVAEIKQSHIDVCFLCLGPTKVMPSKFLSVMGDLIAEEGQGLVVLAEKMGDEWMYVAVNAYAGT